MTTDEHRLSRKTLNVIAASVIVSAVLLGLLYTVGTHRCLEKTLGFGQETMVFLENACEKYDRYEQGRKTEATHDLLAAVESFATFLSSDRVEVNDDLIERFVHAENLSGLMVMDSDGHMVAHYDIDGRDPLMLWRDELACSPVASMYQGSKVTYSTVDERRGVVFAVCAVPYGDGVALAYRSLVSDTADDYSYAIADVLSNSTFHQGPTVLVMEDAEIVSSNSADADVSLARLLTSVGVEWKDDGLTRIEYRGDEWYAVRAAYEDYRLFALYPKSEVMSGRISFIAVGVLAFLVFLVVVLLVRIVADRRNLAEKDKQLGIINAISSTYESTLLLHLDTLEIEGINMSPSVAKIFAEHAEAYDFFATVCRDIVSPESREAVMELLDIKTLQDRMEGMPYLDAEVRDCRGTWYSLQVVPQRRDEQGRLESVVVAAHNISMIKRAEELSFQDKLTGLRNRNYLESLGDDLVNDSLPVSVIMMDCNFLKRTNDLYGHEMGDELLRRMASVLRRTAGEKFVPMRIGGDEFLLICPHTDRESACEVVQDLRLSLAAASDEMLTVSASFGVATAEAPGYTLTEIYHIADHNMYQEKRKVHAREADC
ncbi:GGDEF domain-containing protein [Collinsella sp. AM41-2BH]|uniref:GGDEF domain-containing protein n=1 Tax=Collinsella sp. AM41-2BH TaxID=2292320 RepID=UPI000E4D10A6|nr:GGDEF domain-containing protein [Collinsella sp. AM41-2BH]RHB10345.1 GGDEF domain-containing protein [Collinsella sp. AM41-2BH]